ncbi:uncharacterized protein LOC141620719 [Silene latifolia]|uniref:uncharacterized protein LOC141620719 n=1 Tax=Silene latifolia TaxID=37657 RepID=UPI003D78B1F6
MAMTNVLTISQLKYGVRLTQMNVRVVHKWSRLEFSNKNNKDNKKKLDAIELLFVDSENEVIQATIRKQLISHFGSQLSVGEVYTICNLTVDNNTGLDKATPHPYRLKFEYSTKVHSTSDPAIPISLYRFASFNDILDGKVPNTHYIDVIGKLYEIGPITETPNKYACRTIKLEDFQGTKLSCTLWDPFTVQIPDIISKLPNPEQSKVIVIQCVQTKKYEGNWRVQTTFNATVFQVNPDIPELKEFEQSLSTPAASNSLQIIDVTDDDENNDMTLDSIKSISDIKENEKEGYYYTYAKIIDLDCTAGWYYDSCKLCWTKGTKNQKGRFQIKFQVSDPSDDLVYFVVFDSQVNQFVTQSATEMLSKIEKSGGDPQDIPRDLKVFLDKSFVFKIHIHPKYNVAQGGTNYTVASMTANPDIAHKWHQRYTEIFKICYNFLKPVIKDLAVHSIDVEEEPSQTEDNSPKITPQKRPSPIDDLQSCDASSATKKTAIVKTEK